MGLLGDVDFKDVHGEVIIGITQAVLVLAGGTKQINATMIENRRAVEEYRRIASGKEET